MAGSLLPVAAITAGVLFVLLLAPMVFRETRRAHAIDRRLARLRELAVADAPIARDASPAGGGPFRAIGAALLRVGSMLVPVGAAEREKLAGLLRRGGFAQRDALSVFLSQRAYSLLTYYFTTIIDLFDLIRDQTESGFDSNAA